MTEAKRAATAKLIKTLNEKVRSGAISYEEAETLTLAALEEVKEASAADGDLSELSDEITPDDNAEDMSDDSSNAPVSAIEPKSQIPQMLTALETQISSTFLTFKNQLISLVKGTSEAAVPVGEYSIGAGDRTAKLTITQNDQASVNVVFQIREEWDIAGLTMNSLVQSSTGACHLPLRKQILSMSRYAERDLSEVREEAIAANDQRVLDIVKTRVTSSADKAAWPTAVEAFLLGSDYSARRSFKEILREVADQ